MTDPNAAAQAAAAAAANAAAANAAAAAAANANYIGNVLGQTDNGYLVGNLMKPPPPPPEVVERVGRFALKAGREILRAVFKV